ncbi:MAG: 50S ribosomal protein L4, partial [Chloroflexi bacterium]|nr:50S ribosomal protein L4 [Chloroflexota bacterium]
MDLQVQDNKGKVVGSVAASDQVWRAESNDALLHQVVTAQQANKRRGTQDTQQRNQVSYSTRKIRPQKGTGQARQGSRRSPLLKGGGVAHGPHPRSYRQRLPKKMRRQALRVALSEKIRDEALIVL